MFFGAGISVNASSMRVILFGICLKLYIDFRNAKKKSEFFYLFDLIASELVVLNCLYSADDACHQQAMS